MPDKQHHTPTGELSYYGLSLLSYLKDSHPELIAEGEFIAERADSAAQAYSEAIRSGCNHIEAEEIAREELCRGLHFSPYNTLVNILWRIPPGRRLYACCPSAAGCWRSTTSRTTSPTRPTTNCSIPN